MTRIPNPSIAAALLAETSRSPEEWLQLATQILTRGIEAIGAVIIAIGVIRALVRWVSQHLPGGREKITTESIRLGLGSTLGLALEFLLAADILSTAVAPTWDAIGKLAAVATIRTLLNYFLGRELANEQRQGAKLATPHAPNSSSEGVRSGDTAASSF
jgi:uncharacterized membrane protein